MRKTKQEQRNREQRNRKRRGGLAAIGLSLLAAALIALTVRSFAFQLVFVRSDAMSSTLLPGDIVLVSRTAVPDTGSIAYVGALNGMVFRRVIGRPGETVTAQNGVVYIGNAPLYEPYARDAGAMEAMSETLAPNAYLLMADDRSLPASLARADSLSGVVLAVVWPLGRACFL